MRNPLHRRFGRQLVQEAGRYLGIFALLVVTIGVVSGFLATSSSMQKTYAGLDETNALEDARFETSDAITDEARSAVEGLGAKVNDDPSRDAEVTQDDLKATIRVYVSQNRTEMDTPSLFEGRLPEADDEIALDDTFCANHGLEVGDTIGLEGKTFTICGRMVLPDYTALMRSNSDMVMDAVTFAVALVDSDGFARLSDLPTSYVYSLAFDDGSLSAAGHTDLETDVGKALTSNGTQVTALLDRNQNQGISFFGKDAKGDSTMYMAFLYIMIVVMAFIFVILTNATVEKESSEIGTLLASGWRKGEILRHYLFLPAFVGIVAVVAGNALGYTIFSRMARDLYYRSYSLPPFQASFDAKTFVLTSVLPYAMLVGIAFVGIARKLGATPLAFLRHEVSRGRSRRHVRLTPKLGYVTRFRLRVLMRNVPTFVTLFLGVLVGSVLVMFSLALLPTFEDYAKRVAASMPVEHIYTLKAPYELEMTSSQQDLRDRLARLVNLSAAGEMGLGDMAEGLAEGLHPVADDGTYTQEQMGQAEKLCVASLKTQRRQSAGMEDVTAYGIQEGSRYWTDIDVSDGRVLVGAGLLMKCGLEPGDVIVLYDKYADKSYAFTIDEATGDWANTSVYMSQETFNEALGHDADWFCAYASDEELAMDPDYLASTLTPNDMQRLADEMLGMFSDTIRLLLRAAALVFFVVMYLLAKTVFDHSARSISYMKVFGYRDREIRRLYLTSITEAVAMALVAGLPMTMWAISTLMSTIMLEYSGNFVVGYTPQIICGELTMGFATYVVVALLHMRQTKRVPLELALKTQE